MPSTASSALGKYGTSGSKTGATPSVSRVSPSRSSEAQPARSAKPMRTGEGRTNRGQTTVSLWILRPGNRGLSPVSEEHDRRSDGEDPQAHEGVGPVVGEARVEQIRAGEHEDSRHHRIARHAEGPWRIAFLHSQDEEGDPGQHEKSPEHRQRIFHQPLEAR